LRVAREDADFVEEERAAASRVDEAVDVGLNRCAADRDEWPLRTRRVTMDFSRDGRL
jgi:hypothetical protein